MQSKHYKVVNCYFPYGDTEDRVNTLEYYIWIHSGRVNTKQSCEQLCNMWESYN